MSSAKCRPFCSGLNVYGFVEYYQDRSVGRRNIVSVPTYPLNHILLRSLPRRDINVVASQIMMTSSNGNIFRVTGPLCGEFTGPGEFPAQRPVTRSFGVFFDLRLNKRLSKQPWGWWFETPWWSLWRHCNVIVNSTVCSRRCPGSKENIKVLHFWAFVRRIHRKIPLTNGQ